MKTKLNQFLYALDEMVAVAVLGMFQGFLFVYFFKLSSKQMQTSQGFVLWVLNVFFFHLLNFLKEGVQRNKVLVSRPVEVTKCSKE